MKLCACGCGLPVPSWKQGSKYRHNHWQKSPEGKATTGKLWKQKFARDKQFQQNMKAKWETQRGKPGRPNTEAQKKAIGLANTKYFFEYKGMTPELAYVIGAYLSDGCIFNKQSSIELVVVDSEFADKFAGALLVVQPNQHIHFGVKKPGGRAKQEAVRVQASNKRLCTWLLDATNEKAKIPDYVMSASPVSQAACLSGLFDGDGSANHYGVYIATSFSWIFQAHQLCKRLNMRPNDIRIQQYLSGNRPYRIFTIKRKDFLNSPVQFSIKRKAQRLQDHIPT